MEDDIICTFTIPICPRSKKNSMQIVRCGRFPRLVPSKAYKQYLSDVGKLGLNKYVSQPISERINVRAMYYMDTRRTVDKTNLENALCDVLKSICLIADDNCLIVASTDGSRVLYDKHNPRTEVTITRNGEVNPFA
jgi:Holliday junction resolvase RusA-like endonuclease